MKKWLRKAIIFSITISFVFNSGLGEIISYAQTVDMDGIYQSVASGFKLASAEGEVSTIAESTASEYFEYTEVDGGVSITKYTGSDTEVVIPSTIDGKDVKTIGQSAFAGSKTLVSVVIPDGVTEIGSYAFSACSKLNSVTIVYVAKIVQIEDNTKQTCLFLLLRCSLFYTKIVQIEDNTKQTRLFLLLRCSLSYAKIVFSAKTTR